MNRTTLPWILLAAVAGAWIGTSTFREVPAPTPAAPLDPRRSAEIEERIGELRDVIGALVTQVEALREAVGQKPTERVSSSNETASPAPGDEPQPDADATATQDGESELVAVGKFYEKWLGDIQSLKDAGVRQAALAEVRASFAGDDPVKLLAALYVVRWMGDVEYDREDFRAQILPHARSEEPRVRRAAREALVAVKPDAADLPMWLEEAGTADRNSAETTAMNLVWLAKGIVRNDVAEAVLHLLRDGSDIRKAFVMRGLQSMKEMDPRVEARLIEIVRSVDAQNYDSAYFFHFLASPMDPKSDAIVDLILDRASDGKGEIGTVLHGLRCGLSEPQRARAAATLISLAENAGSTYARHSVLQALTHIAGPEQIERLEVIADKTTNEHIRQLAREAVEAARSRR